MKFGKIVAGILIKRGYAAVGESKTFFSKDYWRFNARVWLRYGVNVSISSDGCEILLLSSTHDVERLEEILMWLDNAPQ